MDDARDQPKAGLVVVNTSTDVMPVQRRRVESVTIVEVQEMELEELQRASSEENEVGAFFWGFAGLSGGGVFGLLAGYSAMSPAALAVYCALLGVACVSTVWFRRKAVRAAASRKNVLDRIRRSGKQGANP